MWQQGYIPPKSNNKKKTRYPLKDIILIIIALLPILIAGFYLIYIYVENENSTNKLNQSIRLGTALIPDSFAAIDDGISYYTYRTTTLPDSFANHDFTISLISGNSTRAYVPKETISYDSFLSIVDYLKSTYGECSYIKGDKYCWFSEDFSFNLIAVYDKDLYHNCAFGIIKS